MRLLCTLFFLLGALWAMPQEGYLDGPRPLVINEAVALPLSSAQVMQAALGAWAFSFGQQPGASPVPEQADAGRLEGAARFNYRSSTLGSREQTLGVIHYQVSLHAENGQCRIRIAHFTHVGNKNAPGGPVDLGTIYAGDRPAEPVRGVSSGSASRLHEDMRTQVTAHLRDVIKVFSARIRLLAEDP